MSTTTTAIEWTDRTWNPVRGCSRVSEGCRNCYAEKIAARFSSEGQAFHLFADNRKSGSKWTGKVELVESALSEPLKWRKPARVFVNSMSDLFHEALSGESINRVFAVMSQCPHLTFQVLTKRAERMAEWIASRAFVVRPPNVWLGVSVENQQTADERIPPLLQIPVVAVRFVSYEPALGPVNFGMWLGGLDWIIAGGESGRGARPAPPDWFRSARDQCSAAGVPFFFKQWGNYSPLPIGGNVDDGINVPIGDGTHHRMFSASKKSAGCLLDGRQWREFPNA